MKRLKEFDLDDLLYGLVSTVICGALAFFFVLIFVVGKSAHAEVVGDRQLSEAVIPSLGQSNCWEAASTRYGIEAHLLYAIAKTESNLNPQALSPANAIGVMQIHDSWLPTLKQHGISLSDLWQPCTNIMVGAWVLAQNIKKYGPTWESVGAYNASCTKLKGHFCTQARQRYIRQVQKNLSRLTQPPVYKGGRYAY